VAIGPPGRSGTDPVVDRLARCAEAHLRCRIMADQVPPLSPQTQPLASDASSFLESLMDTELYSIGAFFCDEHPDLVDEVVARSEAIERSGLEAYSRQNEGPIEESFETLLTGLAVRYYKAVAG
jgi:hypothetical protein